ncbi:MAG TPA: hypothetical protein VGB18_03480 [Candidatus Thermoplasmatota archaeon]
MGNRWAWGIAAMFLLSGCLGATLSDVRKGQLLSIPEVPDPAIAGPLAIDSLDYDLGQMSVTDPGRPQVPFPSHVIGNVFFPTEGAAPFPVILFLHGRHSTCGFTPTRAETLGPVICPNTPVTYSVDSYTGYDYISANLASHGYVVISASANNVNDLDNNYADRGALARSQIIAHTLDEFQRFNASEGPEPVGARLVGKLDYATIGIMGHSRGGEGVNRAVSYLKERTDGPHHNVVAVFSLAPIDFNRLAVSDVAWLTLLPYCDGDVSDLSGQRVYDRSLYVAETLPRPKIQILALGSNHNYYNTVWTGDDGGSWQQDQNCGPADGPATFDGWKRLSPEDQRRHGLVYIAGFFRAYLGNEPGFTRLFSPLTSPPASACPLEQPSCRGMIHVSYHAPQAERVLVEDAAGPETLTQNDQGGINSFTGFTNLTVCKPADCPDRPNHAAASLLQLGWDAPGARATFELPSGGLDASSLDVISFRVALGTDDERNSRDALQDFHVVLFDDAGNSQHVRVSAVSPALFPPPGDESRKLSLNTAAIPLSEFSGIDLSRLVRVELVFDVTSSGDLYVADLQFQQIP